MRRTKSLAALLITTACGPSVAVGEGSATEAVDSSGATASSADTTTGTTTEGDENEDAADDWHDVQHDPPDPPEVAPLDVLFVVDNSAQTADMQLRLGQAMAGFVESFGDAERSVQVMFTTTDVGNPLCSPFQPVGYTPAAGAPTTTGCNARIDDFTGLGGSPEVRDEVCSELCPFDITPSDPFVAFDPGTGDHNVGNGTVVEALRCLLPQGINGCGYEAPLEAMARALRSDAPHNSGDRPFLRPDADLAIVILTNETDCSVDDLSFGQDMTYWNVNPHSGSPQPSSAMCWNAGVQCDGPDANGVYSECVSSDGPLHATSRYTDMLADLRGSGKRVTMLSIGGVPPVGLYADDPPVPTAGGLLDLVYREWQESDVSPQELADGVSAEDLTFELGIGPACALLDDDVLLARAIPNPRVVEVCQSLDDGEQLGCCIDSVCGDQAAALRCLVGVASQ